MRALLLAVAVPLFALACAEVPSPPLPPGPDVQDTFDRRCHDFLDAMRRDRFGDAARLEELANEDPGTEPFRLRRYWHNITGAVGEATGWQILDRRAFPGSEVRQMRIVFGHHVAANFVCRVDATSHNITGYQLTVSNAVMFSGGTIGTGM